MGLLTAAGSLARVLGPLMVSYVYNGYGLYVTYGLIMASMIIALILTVLFYKRMVPLKMPGELTQNGQDKNGAAVLGSMRQKRDSIISTTSDLFG